MKFKQSWFLKNPFNTVWFFPLSILLLIITLSLYLHPGIKPRWNSHYRTRLLDNFLQDIQTMKKIEPQSFWIFRERYSPGTFKINPETIGVFQTFRIVNVNQKRKTDLLFYDSPYLQSTESLTSNLEIINQLAQNVPKEQVELQTADILLIKKQEEENSEKTIGQYELWFVLPIEQMKKANGFFDYTSDERELIEDKYWLNHSLIFTQ